MNLAAADKRLRYFCPDLDRPLRIQIQSQMASGPRETCGANERPDFAASRRNESRQIFWLHAASDHSRVNRLRICQFDLVAHGFVLADHLITFTKVKLS